MKILITEQQLNELFDGSNTYPVTLTNYKKYHGEYTLLTYNYEFTTKDDIVYVIGFNINADSRRGRLDFFTREKDDAYDFNSIDLVNKFDALKVFNTLKYIIYKHKDEFDDLILESTENRILFYEKLLTRMNIPFKKDGCCTLIAKVN